MEKLLERSPFDVIHKKPIPNQDRTHMGEIPGWAERQFFHFMSAICERRGWKIQYEPTTFRIDLRNGEKMSTAPDFLITRPGKKDIYIELNRGCYEVKNPFTKDPALRQKRIMSYFPDVIYKVLYRQDMDKIERKHPYVSFKPPNSKKSRKQWGLEIAA